MSTEELQQAYGPKLCPFCGEIIPADFLATLMAQQQRQWSERHEAQTPHPLTMIGRGSENPRP